MVAPALRAHRAAASRGAGPAHLVPRGRGVRRLEWTSSSFEPYPGFKAFPYEGYSAAFFGTGLYRVLRGGSWATHGKVGRHTFRNWDFPERRQIFAGLRLAHDIA